MEEPNLLERQASDYFTSYEDLQVINNINLDYFVSEIILQLNNKYYY